MEPRREGPDITTELRALRPAPRRQFTEELDARAAAGFPRPTGHTASPFRRAVERLRATPPRRTVALAGACAVAAIAVATAVVASTESDSGPSLSLNDTTAPLHPYSAPSTVPVKPQHATPGESSAPNAAAGRGEASGGTSGSGASAEAHTASGPTRLAQPADSSARATHFEEQIGESGPYAANAAKRDVERSAQLVLATDASGVRPAAGRVFETVHANHGIVLNSSISDGGNGEAEARFRLLIPSGRLSDALASFSEIADVRARHESTADVTAPTIGLEERLRDARARVESLLGQLAHAETEAKREVAETKLRSARSRVAALRGRLAGLQRRTHLSAVSLRIESGGDAGSAGAWGVKDALADAGHILAVAGGVALIGLAILLPPALLCLLAWLGYRLWVRRRRERALG